ncbi:MAG: LOG family protein [Chloroflexi bacterium]|nr:LOG family protein [Chloroflexota bacterium]
MTESNTTQRVVAVYGGASIIPGGEDWQAAYDVGRSLAAAGYAVLTGGYAGVMEAASQGAAEAGGRVIGVTVGTFEQRGLVPNPYLNEEVRMDTLQDRLLYVVTRPDAIVTLRGGVGTLNEVVLAWSLMQVGEISPRPLVLVGPMWRRLIAVFAEDAVMKPRELGRLVLVDTADDVVPALAAWWANPPTVPLRLGDDGYTP